MFSIGFSFNKTININLFIPDGLDPFMDDVFVAYKNNHNGHVINELFI